MASGLLPKSPMSSSMCDEVPHIFVPKSHLEPREFLIGSAKVGGPLQVSNFRIQRAPLLNQSCATDPLLESMLRVGMRKIFLQQYLPQADIHVSSFLSQGGSGAKRFAIKSMNARIFAG